MLKVLIPLVPLTLVLGIVIGSLIRELLIMYAKNLQLFESYYDTKPLNVRLPNGSSVLAYFAGSIRVNKELVSERCIIFA